MTTLNSKVAQALFPILTAALLAAGCSDSTGPSTTQDDDKKEVPPIGTTTGPSGPPSGVPPAPNGGPPGSASLMVEVAESVTSNVMGDLSPCEWYGVWCFRWVDMNDPVYLQLAIQFTDDYVYIYERMYLTADPWAFRNAVSRFDWSVWDWNGQVWHRYQPNSVELDPNHFIIGAPDGCGVGVLCSHGMLNPANRLWNGTPVVDFLGRLASGT